MNINETGEICTIAEAERLTRVHRTTIKSAIERGEIEAGELAGGTIVMRLAEVTMWSSVDRKRGRPRKRKPLEEPKTPPPPPPDPPPIKRAPPKPPTYRTIPLEERLIGSFEERVKQRRLQEQEGG